jgi:primosomal protein N' (replication factor Y)
LRTRDARSAKSEIRRAGFLLKKIRKSDILEAYLPEELIKALRACADYYAASIGSLLSSLLPKFAMEDPKLFLKTPLKKKRTETETRETLLLQMEGEERFAQYRALVRQSFARGSSVLVVVPTHYDLEKAEAELSKGIAEFVYVFSLEEKRSEARKKWLKALEARHPVLFITTPIGLLFSRPDLGTIIIERENSRAYRQITRPYVHTRVIAEKLSQETGKQLVLGDSVLSLETLWKEKQGEYGENSLIRWRLPAAATALVDSSVKQNQDGHFEIFSPKLKELIVKALEEREGIFLFGARKGLAPATVCGDCGFVLPCLNCGAPVVLHRQKVEKPAGLSSETVYICHACRERRGSTTTCGYCGSWKLVPLGIGTEEIARQARELFPHGHVAILDRDHAPTDRQARAIAEKFRATGGILVGTELAFFHVGPVGYSALVSADALFSVPDFGINERIFYLVSRLREMTRKESLVQTRNIGKQVLAWASLGNIIDFYQGEIEEREALLYPPFSIFIKVTAPPKELARLASLKEGLSRWRPDIFKDSLIIRVARDIWPDSELVRELSLLGPQFSIKVDPESIL